MTSVFLNHISHKVKSPIVKSSGADMLMSRMVEWLSTKCVGVRSGWARGRRGGFVIYRESLEVSAKLHVVTTTSLHSQ